VHKSAEQPDTSPGITTQIGQPPRLIEVTRVGHIGRDEILLRLVASDPSSEETLLKQRLGLTTRESEVLVWLGRGKSNRDIAEILGLSPRTVNKHLELIYAKLGVENRAAAAGIAVRTAGRL
jgi:DNA-binding CsgD family transcriptional regulator